MSAKTKSQGDSGAAKETRWDRRRRKRTEEIIEVAMRLVMEEGLDACSLHRISRELDVAVAGLYRYFPSKMALIAALELRVIDEINESLEEARGKCAEPEEAVDGLACVLIEGEVYRAYALEAPARFALIQQIMADPNVLLPGDMGQKIVVNMMTLLAGVGRSFAIAAEAGGLAPGDPLERSVLFWNGIRSVLQMKKLENHSKLVDYHRFYKAMLNALLVGWGADPAHLAPAWKRAKEWLG